MSVYLRPAIEHRLSCDRSLPSSTYVGDHLCLFRPSQSCSPPSLPSNSPVPHPLYPFPRDWRLKLKGLLSNVHHHGPLVPWGQKCLRTRAGSMAIVGVQLNRKRDGQADTIGAAFEMLHVVILIMYDSGRQPLVDNHLIDR